MPTPVWLFVIYTLLHSIFSHVIKGLVISLGWNLTSSVGRVDRTSRPDLFDEMLKTKVVPDEIKLDLILRKPELEGNPVQFGVRVISEIGERGTVGEGKRLTYAVAYAAVDEPVKSRWGDGEIIRVFAHMGAGWGFQGWLSTKELTDVVFEPRIDKFERSMVEKISVVSDEKDKLMYIHYGHKEFDKTEFRAIENKLFRNKPIGGLWASPVDAQFGWKDWSKSVGASDFVKISEDCSFKFTLSSTAKVLVISSVADVEKLPTQICNDDRLKDLVESTDATGVKSIDFEALKNSGYDAVELKFSNDDGLYRAMFGWDCDSIVVLNPDVVEPVLEKTVENILTDATVRSKATVSGSYKVNDVYGKE